MSTYARTLLLGLSVVAWMGMPALADQASDQAGLAAANKAAKRFTPEVTAAVREAVEMKQKRPTDGVFAHGRLKVTTTPSIEVLGTKHDLDEGFTKNHERKITFDRADKPNKATIVVSSLLISPSGQVAITKTQTITHERSFFGLVKTRTEHNERVSEDIMSDVHRTKQPVQKTRSVLGVKFNVRVR